MAMLLIAVDSGGLITLIATILYWLVVSQYYKTLLLMLMAPIKTNNTDTVVTLATFGSEKYSNFFFSKEVKSLEDELTAADY